MTSIINSSYYVTLINNNMATLSPIRSQNATRLIFVYKSDVIGVEVYCKINFDSILSCNILNHSIMNMFVDDTADYDYNHFFFFFFAEHKPKYPILLVGQNRETGTPVIHYLFAGNFLLSPYKF